MDTQERAIIVSGATSGVGKTTASIPAPQPACSAPRILPLGNLAVPTRIAR
jgi:hypothetical protein